MVPVDEEVYEKSEGAMTPQHGMLHMMHQGRRCEGEFVFFNRNDPPIITDANAPSVNVADERSRGIAEKF
ncbi:MAG: hypothetical protein VYC81_05785, partial [Actinomycetota bacterium]|nr:hypothetical protein [Actinomycetota bacterium]